MEKSKIRNKFIKIRQLSNKNNIKIDFKKIFYLINKMKLNKNIIGGYYPVNFEIDDLDILKNFEKKNFDISLPIIQDKFSMNFYKWSFNEPLKINKYGIPEPITTKIVYPDIILVPLVAFDETLNRIGYGGGYYDRFIKKLEKKKKIFKIGLAIANQKIKNVPINNHDQKLDCIVTNKDIIK